MLILRFMNCIYFLNCSKVTNVPECIFLTCITCAVLLAKIQHCHFKTGVLAMTSEGHKNGLDPPDFLPIKDDSSAAGPYAPWNPVSGGSLSFCLKVFGRSKSTSIIHLPKELFCQLSTIGEYAYYGLCEYLRLYCLGLSISKFLHSLFHTYL